MSKCLCCEKPGGEDRYHAHCLDELFGKAYPPSISFGLAGLPEQVGKTGGRMSISGVQMKLSVRLNPDDWMLEAVAEGGTHILKPEPSQYPELPQNENLCMNMAKEMNMNVPPHGLFSMADGKLCYIIKRFDRREDGAKIQKETLFQILESEDKYGGSLEQIGKAIRAHAANIGLDLINFFERALLSFLIGNGDMHLKNWAVLIFNEGAAVLAPCYDFVSSKIYISNEEDSALTINGKRNQLSRGDFEALASSLKIDPKAAQNSFRKLSRAKKQIFEMCIQSQLTLPLRRKLVDVINSRYERLYGAVPD